MLTNTPSNTYCRAPGTTQVKTFFCVGMPYNWSFYHPDPIEGEEGGILLFHYSMINVYGLSFNILMASCDDRSPTLLPPSGIMLTEHPSVSKSYAINWKTQVKTCS